MKDLGLEGPVVFVVGRNLPVNLQDRITHLGPELGETWAVEGFGRDQSIEVFEEKVGQLHFLQHDHFGLLQGLVLDFEEALDGFVLLNDFPLIVLLLSTKFLDHNSFLEQFVQELLP